MSATPTPLSLCCSAPACVDWSGRENGREADGGTTCWWRCSRCGEACDPRPPEHTTPTGGGPCAKCGKAVNLARTPCEPLEHTAVVWVPNAEEQRRPLGVNEEQTKKEGE